MGVRAHRKRPPKKHPNDLLDDKRNAQIKHCWTRGIERYGVFIGPEQNAELVKQIQENRAGFIEKQGYNKSAWMVEFAGQKFPVIYNKKLKVIVTCLPMMFLVGKTVRYPGEKNMSNEFGDESITPNEKLFITQYNEMSAKVCKTAEEHGFHENEDIRDLKVLGNKMMLMVGELSEAHESIRKDGLEALCEKPVKITALEEEFADTIIRIMDTSSRLNLDIGRAIVLKAKYNESRPYKHGKKF